MVISVIAVKKNALSPIVCIVEGIVISARFRAVEKALFGIEIKFGFGVVLNFISLTPHS